MLPPKESIKLQEVSFKSADPSSYKKSFGKEKDMLRERGFPNKETTEFVKSNMNEKSVKRIKKHISDDTVLLSMPTKQDSKTPNTLPKIYGKELAASLKTTHIDLNDYLKVRQKTSARSSYNTDQRAVNHFNIGFRNQTKEAELKSLLYNKSVLLVDDVITTGETMVTMATFLKSKINNLDIKGGNSLVAATNRRPTTRDIERVNEKLINLLPARTDPTKVRSVIDDAFSNFTRKKMMRFEYKLDNPHGANLQYQIMQQDTAKIQESLKKSISGILHDYPLDKEELAVLHNADPSQLKDSFALRALLDHYPQATFRENDNGSINLYSDQSETKRLSISDNPHNTQRQAMVEGIRFIQQEFKQQNKSQEQSINIKDDQSLKR